MLGGIYINKENSFKLKTNFFNLIKETTHESEIEKAILRILRFNYIFYNSNNNTSPHKISKSLVECLRKILDNPILYTEEEEKEINLIIREVIRKKPKMQRIIGADEWFLVLYAYKLLNFEIENIYAKNYVEYIFLQKQIHNIGKDRFTYFAKNFNIQSYDNYLAKTALSLFINRTVDKYNNAKNLALSKVDSLEKYYGEESLKSTLLNYINFGNTIDEISNKTNITKNIVKILIKKYNIQKIERYSLNLDLINFDKYNNILIENPDNTINIQELIEGNMAYLINDNIPDIYDIEKINEIAFERNFASFKEGHEKIVLHKLKERNPQLRKEAIKFHKQRQNCDTLYCEVCGFNYKIFFNSYIEDCIEIHHKKPISQLKKEEVVRVEDTMPVCPSCHRAIHSRFIPYTKEELQSFIHNTSKIDYFKSFNNIII